MFQRCVSAPKQNNAYLALAVFEQFEIWAFDERFCSLSWDFGLRVGIWASRLGFGPQGRNWDWDLSPRGGRMEKEEEKEKEEKIPHTCESIGHRPLRCRCPKANDLFVSVSHPNNEKNIAWEKFMTILNLCERSLKWDLAGCPSSIRLEMALGWRSIVKNLEIHHVIIFILT